MTELTEKRPVLDHGYVQYIDHMGDDLSPLEAARLSTGRETGVDVQADDKLRSRLWSEFHTSPFEMAELVVEIQCPIFVLRQIDRHRSIDYDGTTIESQDENARQFMSRNEFSGRYSTMPDLFFIPPAERIQKKGVANKQGSEGGLDPELQKKIRSQFEDQTQGSRAFYEQLIGAGVASEIARVALPLNQYTKIRLKGSLLSWLKVLDLRLRLDVQLECRVFAQEIAKIVRRLWPRMWSVFEEHTLYAVTIPATAREALIKLLADQHSDLVKLLKPSEPRGLVPEGD